MLRIGTKTSNYQEVLRPYFRLLRQATPPFPLQQLPAGSFFSCQVFRGLCCVCELLPATEVLLQALWCVWVWEQAKIEREDSPNKIPNYMKRHIQMHLYKQAISHINTPFVRKLDTYQSLYLLLSCLHKPRRKGTMRYRKEERRGGDSSSWTVSENSVMYRKRSLRQHRLKRWIGNMLQAGENCYSVAIIGYRKQLENIHCICYTFVFLNYLANVFVFCILKVPYYAIYTFMSLIHKHVSLLCKEIL